MKTVVLRRWDGWPRAEQTRPVRFSSSVTFINFF